MLLLSLTAAAQPKADWGAAHWIGAGKANSGPLFRKPFQVKGAVRQATLEITGLGCYEASINGGQVGDNFLDPGWTDYRKTIPYNGFDVTAMIRPGANVLGVELGNGWYNLAPLRMWGHLSMRDYLATGEPRLIAHLQIIYKDGRKENIVSDASWVTKEGPLVSNDVYLGSVFDARRQDLHWNTPAGQQRGWRPVVLVDAPGGELKPMVQPPMTRGSLMSPVSIRPVGGNRFIADMGVNFTGTIMLTVPQGRKGEHIRIRYGELLYPDGSLNGMTSVAGQIKGRGVGGPGAPDTVFQQDELICDTGLNVFMPKFAFHGFRYVELQGYPGVPTNIDIIGIPLHANVAQAGNFYCSDTTLNQIQQLCVRTFLNNLSSVQSDCPHREKLGYGGDIVATCRSMIYNFDMHAFYKKVVEDYTDAQQSDGGLPETAPYVGIADGGQTPTTGPIGWGTVLPDLLWQIYLNYGDTAFVAANYEKAKAWVHFIDVHAPDHIVTPDISDHESLDPQEPAITGTAFFYANARLMELLAASLGYENDAALYATLADTIQQIWLRNFYDSTTGFVGHHTQADQAIAMAFGVLPADKQKMAVKVLLEEIEKADFHLRTGIFGTSSLLEILSREGYTDVAVRIAQQRSFPGWGYMLERGATTLWEHWEYSDNTFSHDHPMFGSISAWFYRYVAGIRPAGLGWSTIEFEPGLPHQIDAAEASYYTPNGPAAIQWKRDETGLHVDVTVPPYTKAVLILPKGRMPLAGDAAPGKFHFDVK